MDRKCLKALAFKPDVGHQAQPVAVGSGRERPDLSGLLVGSVPPRISVPLFRRLVER